jgi:hypothetical protein
MHGLSYAIAPVILSAFDFARPGNSTCGGFIENEMQGRQSYYRTWDYQAPVLHELPSATPRPAINIYTCVRTYWRRPLRNRRVLRTCSSKPKGNILRRLGAHNP